jgi:hypothetical protein
MIHHGKVIVNHEERSASLHHHGHSHGHHSHGAPLLDGASPHTDPSGGNTTRIDHFRHFDDDECDGPSLPPTIYSSAILAPLGFAAEDLSGCCSWLWCTAIVVPQWLLVFLNYFFCIVVIIAIKEIRDDSGMCKADWLLSVFCVGVFSCYNIGEIVETLGLFFWLYQFPTGRKCEPLTFTIDKGSEERRHISSGMTLWYKALVATLILVPKLAFGGLLSWYGNGFLLTCDGNKELIVITVAITFVTQVDELMYIAMVPSHIKIVIENMPVFEITRQQKLVGLFRTYFVGALIAGITWVSFKYTCGARPV